MHIKLETARLWMREIAAGDAPGLFELDSDPVVHRYLGNQPVQTMEEIDSVINMIRQQYSDHGIARWAVLLKENNRFIGWAGLKWITEPINGHVHYYDLGYRLIPSYWGQGYATEASFALLEYAFDVLGVSSVAAMADIENKGSNRVLTKIGMQRIESFVWDGVLHHWYELHRKNFLKHSLTP
ncbi:MAG TPA: GNAT family N-acetyltransferase [Ferruginibacter sp.]|nr:GNAT family N-acetyltransferase [Ferruginibacter sp.]